MKKKSLLTLLMGALLICSCETPRVVYFEDLDHGKTVQARDPLDISLRPGDKIRILVSTRDEQLTQLFNLERYSWWYKVYQYGQWILLILIFTNVTDMILGPAVTGIMHLLGL